MLADDCDWQYLCRDTCEKTKALTPMTILAEQLHQMIAEKGALSVSDYMHHCLLDTHHGYYATSTVFGTEGDFVTAPEISQLFGEMVGAFHAHLFQLFGMPDNAILYEAGGGRGTLSADMQRCYQMIAPQLYNAPCYLIEASARRQDEQRAALAPKEPYFVSAISDLPKQPLFGVANEFFDALGVDQIIFHHGRWHHRLIDSQNGAFCFVIGPELTTAEQQDLTLKPDAEEGDICEVSPNALRFMAELAHHIAHYGGGYLIIDYGKSDNQGDTLQAVKDHKPVDFLSYQGDADITHWVDFAALSQIASANHARLIGPVTQGRFLQDLGIGARAEALRDATNPEQDRALLAAIDRLVSPAQMGHAFKVALLVPDGDGIPPGFTSLAEPDTGTA